MIRLFRPLPYACILFAGAAFAQQVPPPPPQPMLPGPRPAATPAAMPGPTLPPQAAATPAPATSSAPIPPPAPAAKGPSVVLGASPDLPPPQTAQAAIDLKQIRIVRARDFNGGGSAPVTVGVASMTPGGGQTQELMRPGMAFLFRVFTPDYCGILDFKAAHISELLDAHGNPIPLKSSAETPATASAVAGSAAASNVDSNVVSWNQSDAMIQFTTGLPPRGDERLGKLTAELTVDVGIVQPVEIRELRQKIGQTLLAKPNGMDLTVQLQSVNAEQVVVVSEGSVKNLGTFEFFGPGGEPFEPYSNTLDVQAGPGGRPRQTGTYAFFKLPEVLTMKINFYPKIETKKLQIALEQIPLP